jgi:hypothetical protein
MKKFLTITLVFVFAVALVLAVGCAKKEQTSTEGTSTMDQQMEQSAPADTMSTPMMTDTTAAGSTTTH